MFTGIVECRGEVASRTGFSGGMRLGIKATFADDGVKLGDSIAVNGTCLTVAQIDGPFLEFDVITETLNKTNLGALRGDDAVNLERSLRVGDRIDGHWVQGHVDATARISRRIADSRQWVLWISPPPAIQPYIIRKGSIAIDGVSLTVADVSANEFSVALIPTTLERTTLSQLDVGDLVNIETDLLVRTVVQTLAGMQAETSISLEKLRQAGFA
jgi:riboflavin synthase